MAWVNPGTVTAGQVLGATRWNEAVVGNTEFLAKPPSVSVQKSTEQSIANAAYRSVSWNTENWDTDTMWSSTAPTRIDINTAGKYRLTATVAFSSGGAGVRAAGFTVDGSTTATPDPALSRITTSTGYVTTITDVRSLTSTQFVRLQVYQGSGSALNLNHAASEFISKMSAQWVSS